MHIKNDNFTNIWQQFIPTIAWGTIAFFIGIICAYVAVIGAAISGSLSYFYATVVCIYLCFASFTIQHDAGHGSIFAMGSRFKSMEVVIGWLASVPLLVSPFRLFQKIHDRHHAFTNDPDRDPDHFSFGNKWYHILLGIYYMPIKYHVMSVTTFKHIKAFRQTYFSTVVYMIFTVGIMILLSLNGFAFEVWCFAIIPNLVNIFILVLCFDYIPHHPHKSLGRYNNTRIYTGRLLNVLLLGQNYHLIHHMYPRLPWYKYRQVFEKIRPDLEANGAPIEDIGAKNHHRFMHSPNTSSLVKKGPIHRLLKVSHIVPLCKDTVSVRFELPGEDKLHFKAGQYITVSKWLAGKQRTRCYSLCSDPDKGMIEIAVRQTANGLFSKYINTNLKVGDELIVQGPYGDFIFPTHKNNQTHDVVLIAGGSGITPMRAILATFLAQQNNHQAHLLYACHSTDDILFFNYFQTLAKKHPKRLTVDFVISRGIDASIGISGRIDQKLLKSRLSLNNMINPEFYICGPDGLKSIVIDALVADNIPQKNIHIEQFVTQKNTPIGKRHQVTIDMKDGQQQTILAASNQTVLEVAKAENIAIDYACETGTCGSCKITICNGSIKPLNSYINGLTDDEKNAGFTLACQCKPLTDLILKIL